jgi:hypothetical protein
MQMSIRRAFTMVGNLSDLSAYTANDEDPRFVQCDTRGLDGLYRRCVPCSSAHKEAINSLNQSRPVTHLPRPASLPI